MVRMKSDYKYLFGLVCYLAVLISAGFAGQKEASAVMEQAGRLSDIWEKKAFSFHLKADLTLYDEKGASQQGRYVESWASAGQWRRETMVGSAHRIEVANGDKRWLLNSSNISISAFQLRSMLAPWSIDPGFLEKAEIEEKSWHGRALRCVTTKAYPEGKDGVCVDKASGALAVKVKPAKHGKLIGDEICEYDDYQKFGEKIFPHLIRCADGNQLKLELRVTELEPASNLSAGLFTPVDGAKESFNCQGVLRAPRPVSSPNPVPSAIENRNHPVELQVIVGKNGKPKNIEVVRSVDRDYDEAALRAVKRWKFEPATCEGEPIDQEVHVEMEFRVFR